jgi:hypothetical protein
MRVPFPKIIAKKVHWKRKVQKKAKKIFKSRHKKDCDPQISDILSSRLLLRSIKKLQHLAVVIFVSFILFVWV